MKAFYLSLILSFCGILGLNAQIREEFQIGLAAPSGDFAADDFDNAIYNGAGVATNGFYIGYKSLFPLSEDILYWTFSAGFMRNGLTSSYKDEMNDFIFENFDNYNLVSGRKFSKYINIPILMGLQYETELSSTAKFYCEAGAGLNILKITETAIYGKHCFYKSSFKLGYKIGGGVLINDKYTIGVTYLGLGSHRVEYDDDPDAKKVYNKRFDSSLPVSSMNIVFGIRF